MSAKPAPPSRSSKTASTRLATSALVALPLMVLGVDPCGMPVVQAGVVEECKLLDIAVRPQVGGALKDHFSAALEVQAGDLRVRPRGGEGHAAGLELPRGLTELGLVVLGEEIR